MSEQVQSWLRARDTADPDFKSLLDKQILSTAYDVFGDFREKILLSLPPEPRIRGPIRLGNVVYNEERWPAGITEEELMQNMAIFGRSGSGKTNLAFAILEQLVERKIPFLFLDWKRTGRHLIPHLKREAKVFTPGRDLSPFSFNPLIPPPGIELNLYINHLVDVLGSAYTLGDGAKSLVQKALSKAYAEAQGDHSTKRHPTIRDVLAILESRSTQGRESGWKVTAMRALESLNFAGVDGGDPLTQESLLALLTKSYSFIELDSLNQNAKKFLIPMLCLWLYHLLLGQPDRENLKLVVIVEEAHHVFYRQEHKAKESLMEMLMRQCREIGMGILVVDQHPHLISSAVLGNVHTSICLNQKDPVDINKAAGLSLLPDGDKRYLSMLSVGQGIVKFQGKRWHKPFLIQIPHIKIRKGSMTDNLLRGYFKGNRTGSGWKTLLDTEFDRIRQVRFEDYLLEEDAIRLLEDVLKYQDDGVKVRYRRLGLSMDRGNKLKQELVSHGWLHSEHLSVGRTRKVLLRLSKKARETLALDGDAPEHGSIIHEFWKRYYANYFQAQGYITILEAPRQGGRVDVLAKKEGQTIGIEVETGKSDPISNVKNGLATKFDRVVIVATDEKAFNKIQHDLAREGLILPDRVRLVLRDGFRLKKRAEV